MSKPRKKENQGLPSRWRFQHGKFYYSVPPGTEAMWDNKKLFPLGKTLNEAFRLWATRMGDDSPSVRVKTVANLLDRYSLEIIPTKAPASQASNLNQLPSLRAVLGGMALSDVTAQIVYQYIDQRRIKRRDPKTGFVRGGKTAAHREVELLSHAFTMAVKWGYIARHPFKGQLELDGERPRDRYVEDWEVKEALSLKSRRHSGSVEMVQAYIRLKLLTGMAQGDLLRLRTDVHLKEDGIHNKRHKVANVGGRTTIYEWSDDLRRAVDLALRARPNKNSVYLFCNRYGDCYVNEALGRASGWKSMWQRFMARVMAETKVKRHFTEHDLRAKVASDAPTVEHARSLLSHADPRTTERVYIRKPEVVKPLGKSFD